jgi:hypothetical protein
MCLIYVVHTMAQINDAGPLMTIEAAKKLRHHEIAKESDRTLRDGTLGVALSQALRARLRSHRPSGTYRNGLQLSTHGIKVTYSLRLREQTFDGDLGQIRHRSTPDGFRPPRRRIGLGKYC